MNMRFWLEALAEPNRMAAQVFTTSPMNVSTLGLMRESASQRTMVSRRTPQARPKADVQEWLIEDALGKAISLQGAQRYTEETLLSLPLAIRDLERSSFLQAWASFGFSSTSSWIVLRLRISSSRLPLGVTTVASSPTFLFRSARPMGLVVEILPAATSDSSLVTSLYSISSFLVLSKTFTVEPRPTLSVGILFMLIMDNSARRLPSWRTRALTNSCLCLAMWYSAFSLRSPSAAAFLISFGSSWINSCSRVLISSCNFRLI